VKKFNSYCQFTVCLQIDAHNVVSLFYVAFVLPSLFRLFIPPLTHYFSRDFWDRHTKSTDREGYIECKQDEYYMSLKV